MKRLLLVALLLLPCAALAQLWSGILKPTYGVGKCDPFNQASSNSCAIDWSKVGMLGLGNNGSNQGVVPSTNWLQHGSTIAAASCGTDCTSTIQASLTDCTNNPVAVYSGSGATSSANVLTDTLAHFNSLNIQDGASYVNVISGTGVVTGFNVIDSHTDTTLTLRGSLGAGTPSNISYNVFNGEFVLLGAGTFPIVGPSSPATPEVRSHCALRGSGDNSTILNYTGSSTSNLATVVLGQTAAVSGNSPWFSLTGGATAGSTSLTAASTGTTILGGTYNLSNSVTQANINAGKQYLIASELNYFPVVQHSGDSGETASPLVYNWEWAAGDSRSRGQIVRVLGISGNTITTDPPLYTDYVHTLPTWSAATYYPIWAFIRNGTHWYSNCSVVQNRVNSKTANFNAGGTPTSEQIYVTTNMDTQTAGTAGVAVPNPMCGIYVGQTLQVDSEVVTVTAVYNAGASGAPADTSICKFGGGQCAYAGSFTALFSGNHSAISGKTINVWNTALNISAVPGTLSGGVAPTFTATCTSGPCAGGIVVDNPGIGYSPVWEDMGVPLNGSNPPDTQPQVMPVVLDVFAGVENLQIQENGTTTGNWGGNVFHLMCAYCWQKSVFHNYALGQYTLMDYAFRNEIRDSYFSNSFTHTSGTWDGEISVRAVATENLIENNIFDRGHVGAVMFSHGAAGNVASYNYTTGQFDVTYVSSNAATMDIHTLHPQFNLLEGNIGSSSSLDSTWGTSANTTDWRNLWKTTIKACKPFVATRQSPGFITCSPLGYPTQGTAQSWYVFQTTAGSLVSYLATGSNFVGTVIGSDEAQTVISPNTVVLPTSAGASTPTPQLELIGTTTDWANGGQCRSAGGVNQACRVFGNWYGMVFGFGATNDTGASPYAGPMAYNTATLRGVYNNFGAGAGHYYGSTVGIPASAYRTSKPPFWRYSLPTWPMIGSDLTTGDTLNGHAYAQQSNPAQANYIQMGGADGGANTPLTTFDPTWYYNQAPSSPYSVTGAAAGAGSGAITGNDLSHCASGTCPGNMNCTITNGVASGPLCTVSGHSAGDTPTYTATPSGLNSFIEWTNGCSGSSTTCSPDVTTNPTITARFDIVPTTTLSVSLPAVNVGDRVTFTGTITGVDNNPGSAWTLYDPISNPIVSCGYPFTIQCPANGGSITVKALVAGTYTLKAVNSSGTPSNTASAALAVNWILNGTLNR